MKPGCCIWFALAMGPMGFIAVIAGWFVTETGRQPFTVYGVLRTAESASPLAAPAVASSLIAFIIVYFAVFAAGVFYILRLMAQPPHPGEQGPRSDDACARRRHHAGCGRCCGRRRAMIPIDLPTIWAFIIAFAVFVYVVMDGFDLGLGLLFPLFPEKADRDVIMNSVAPVWDGNETWLVLGGGGLFAAFPLAYAVLMPALYTPMMAMLLGLVFRGVAFEFRWRTTRARNRWDIAFAGGSLLATLAQGIALGAILQGVHVEGRHYGGGWWDWLTPFSLLTGLALVAGYSLLGATWLVMKTEGELRDHAYRLSWLLLFAMLGAIGAVSIATPFLHVDYWHRWFTWPSLVYTAPVPILVAVVVLLLLRSLERQQDARPFVLTLVLFAITYAGLGVSMYPFIVPQSITIWQAAAPAKSQQFMLFGVAILIPMIIAYTAFAYWVFRGKVDPEAGYH